MINFGTRAQCTHQKVSQKSDSKSFLNVYFSEPLEVFDPSDFPESYKQNTNKEKLVLAYAENFRKQYIHLYREQNRKPLLLNPVNELQVEVIFLFS
jgi:hypothetical protein